LPFINPKAINELFFQAIANQFRQSRGAWRRLDLDLDLSKGH
jgi:hypothetical protein